MLERTARPLTGEKRFDIGLLLTAIALSLCLLAPAAFGQPKVSVSVKPKPDDKAAPAVPPDSSYALPNNYYGAHLLVADGKPGTRGHQQLGWARKLVGRWGYAKTLFMNIDRNTRGAESGWVDYINRCYAVELIPVIRLGGRMKGGQWIAPEPDAPGDYHSMAQAVKRVVSDFPRSQLCPLYIELWNEPNLAVEWTGKPNAQEYADFFVQVAAAIRSIGDERIRILNGGLATSPEWTEKLCKANPEFINSFDMWSSHPYPHNNPPSINFHDKSVPPGCDLTIDSYLLELDVLRRLGRPDVKVMLTETGYDLGNRTYVKAGQPIIDEYNRADYMVRAFRDYWSQWPEIVAVTPFEFSNEGWGRFDWVRPNSATNQDGAPTDPHYQYTAVAALAKPTDETGAINGTIYIDKLGTRAEGVKALLHLTIQAAVSDPMGNYFLPDVTPGEYRLIVSKPGFKTVKQKVKVDKGVNTVVDLKLTADELVSLAGTVRNGDDGRPIQHVKLKLEPGGHQARTDSLGRYEFEDCIPSRYKLTAEARGLQTYTCDGVDVKFSSRNRHDFVMGKDSSPEAESLIANGGFEAGGGGDKLGIGLGFEPLLPGPQQFEGIWAQLSTRVAHTGQCAQEIRIRPEETAIRQITHYGTARPGMLYVAGAWVRTRAASKDATAWISLDATRNDGSVLRRLNSKPLEGRSTDWVWLEVRGTTPQGSERISIGLHTQGTRGTAIFDDVYLGLLQDRK